MGISIADRLKKLQQLATAYEMADLTEEVVGLCRELHTYTLGFDHDLMRRTLACMRNARAFEAMEMLCNRLLKVGYTQPFVRRFYAQALIDRDRIVSAIETLDKLLAETPDDHSEHREARGLLGRCYKQLYVDSISGVPEERQREVVEASFQHLNKALEHYASVVDLNDIARTDWHTINVIALMVRGQHDGLMKCADVIEAWANRVIAALGPSAELGDNPWALATVGEAYAGLGNWTQARRWLVGFAEHPKVDAFMLYGTIRQLEELWLVKAGSQDTDQIMTLLKHRLVVISRGHINFSKDERQSIVALAGQPDHVLEARLGKEGPKKVKWLKKGFEAARSIARVRNRGYEDRPGRGTGFLVRGGDFIPKLGDEILLLTNEHVISRRADRSACTVQQATITFDEAPEVAPIACKELLWSSGRDDLDASLVRLDATSAKLSAIGLEKLDFLPDDLDQLSDPQKKAYIIGHPEGGDLSMSLDDAEIVDLGRRRKDDDGLFVHYKTPTEPGNSGSPVFNDEWRVVALHHAGPPIMPDGRKVGLRRLSGRDGFHWANEGIALRSIVPRLVKDRADLA